MKATAKTSFKLNPKTEIDKGRLLNLSPQQFAELSSAGLVKKANPKEIEDHLIKKRKLQNPSEKTIEEAE